MFKTFRTVGQGVSKNFIIFSRLLATRIFRSTSILKESFQTDRLRMVTVSFTDSVAFFLSFTQCGLI